MLTWIKPPQEWAEATPLYECRHDSGCYSRENPLPRYGQWPTQWEYMALRYAKDNFDKYGPGGTWNLIEGDRPFRGLKSKYYAFPMYGELHAGGPVTALVTRTGAGYESGLYCGLCQQLKHCGFFKIYDGVPLVRERVHIVNHRLPPKHIHHWS